MTDILLILTGAISLLIIVFLGLKKKSSTRNKKSTYSSKGYSNFQKEFAEKTHQEKDHRDIESERGKDSILPESNQQRNLDREVGGLEASEKPALDSIDPWEGRSEEIDEIGSIDQLGSTGKKSMIWRKKKAKLDAKEAIENMEDHQHMQESKQSVLGFVSKENTKSGFGDMVKSGNNFGGGQGNGGMSR